MRAGLPPALQPLRVRAYRRLALALSASMLAGGVWMVAMVWQVIAIGGGPTEVALIATTTTVVAVAVMLLGTTLSRLRVILAPAAGRGPPVRLSLTGSPTFRLCCWRTPSAERAAEAVGSSDTAATSSAPRAGPGPLSRTSQPCEATSVLVPVVVLEVQVLW